MILTGDVEDNKNAPGKDPRGNPENQVRTKNLIHLPTWVGFEPRPESVKARNSTYVPR